MALPDGEGVGGGPVSAPETERQTFHAEQARLARLERFWLGFTVGAAAQGVVLLALRWWLP